MQGTQEQDASHKRKLDARAQPRPQTKRRVAFGCDICFQLSSVTAPTRVPSSSDLGRSESEGVGSTSFRPETTYDSRRGASRREDSHHPFRKHLISADEGAGILNSRVLEDPMSQSKISPSQPDWEDEMNIHASRRKVNQVDESLTRPGQAARMKPGNEWIEVQKAIYDQASPPLNSRGSCYLSELINCVGAVRIENYLHSPSKATRTVRIASTGVHISPTTSTISPLPRQTGKDNAQPQTVR